MNKIKTSKTSFVDVQKMNKKHPEKFQLPDLTSLKKEDFVKVSTGGERFWTKILAIDGDFIIARIDNDLVYTEKHGLVNENVICFEKKHIYQVL